MNKAEKNLKDFLSDIDQISNLILEISESSRPMFNGEHFITDSELSARLKVSRRTTQEWRNNGIVSYITLGGKLLYRESDIEAMLNANYCRSFDRY